MERPRDISFETLAQVCAIDWQSINSNTRGQLQRALREIRESAPDLEDLELALVIEEKAKTYRRVFENAPLTPTALGKHWDKLDGLLVEQQKPTTYITNDGHYCTTCDGHKMVLKFYRPVTPSIWALERRDKKHPHLGEPHPSHNGPTDGHEEWTPCPDCNQVAQAIVTEAQERFLRIHGRNPSPPPPEVLEAARRAAGAR